MIKKAVGIALMLFSTFAMADRIDELNGYNIQEYCSVTTRFFHGGADGNKSGYARKLGQVRPEFYEYLEHHVPLPKDSMWVTEWDQLSKKEQDFMAGITFEGWDAVQEFKNKDIVPDVDRMTQTYFEGCLAKRAASQVTPAPVHKDRINLRVAYSDDLRAQNEQFAKPTQETCDTIEFDTGVIGGAISDGMPMEELQAFAAKAIPELGTERYNRITRQIKEAYAWDGPFVEWIAKEMKGCN